MISPEQGVSEEQIVAGAVMQKRGLRVAAEIQEEPELTAVGGDAALQRNPRRKAAEGQEWAHAVSPPKRGQKRGAQTLPGTGRLIVNKSAPGRVHGERGVAGVKIIAVGREHLGAFEMVDLDFGDGLALATETKRVAGLADEAVAILRVKVVELFAAQYDEATPTGVHTAREDEIILIDPTGEHAGEQNAPGLHPDGEFFHEAGTKQVVLRQAEQTVAAEIRKRRGRIDDVAGHGVFPMLEIERSSCSRG